MPSTDIKDLLSRKFEFENVPGLVVPGTAYKKERLDGREFQITQLLFGLMKHLGCQTERPGDKVAWTYSFSVKGTTCYVSSEKFGLRLYTPDHLGEQFGKFVRGALIVGLQKYSNVLRNQIGSNLVGLNDFGIINQTSFLRSGYKLFRTKAKDEYVQHSHETGKGLFGIPLNQDPWWYSFSATVSFFSYLEHLYTGLYAFTGTRHTVLELQHFMSLSWRKKHIKLLTEAKVFDANQFTRLNEIFQQQRNLFAHGMGGKKDSSIYRFVPDVGFVPSTLREIPLQPPYWFVAQEHQDTFESNCREFDDFEDFLSTSTLSHGVMWAESGLNFRFDSMFMDELEAALRDNKFDKFLEWNDHMTEKIQNFE